MIYQIKKINRPKLARMYNKSMKELISFFGINWQDNRPGIFLLPNRNTIDALKRKKTDGWLVGWVNYNNVHLLSAENFNRESIHKYSDARYFALMKHELAHCFSNLISGFGQKPVWLLEGISVFASGQNKNRAKPDKLKTFIDFYDKRGREVYLESGFAVEFLVKKYGKKKLFSLLKKIKTVDSKKDFAKLFKSVYGFDLTYRNFKVL